MWPTFLVKIASLAELAAAIQLEVAVAEHLDHFRPQRFRRAAQRHVARRVGGRRFRAELDALLVHDALAADDDDVLLKVVEVLDPFDEQLHVERVLGDQDDVRLPVGRAERDVAGVPPHDFDDGDAAVAFGGGPDALDALRGDQDRRGITGRRVVDDLIEIEDGVATPCACSGSRACCRDP